MAIPSREIGWSTKDNLLWQISKQLQYLTKVTYTAQNNPIVPPFTGGWSLVTGGDAGDGTVAQYVTNGFNITGPDDSDANGWVYIKKYFAEDTQLNIDYQWASADDGTAHDWPIYCLDATEPTGQPSDLTVRANNTPETDTWNVIVPAGTWFSVGIYTDDSCCGRGFLSIFIEELPITVTWTFVPNEISVFPANSDGYTLYEGAWTNYDDGQIVDPVSYAGEFFTEGVGDTQFILSTNGFLFGIINSLGIFGNGGDLFLTPGDSLDDGDTQNFWYQNYIDFNKWRTRILVYCGLYGDQSVPYSYIINLYQDSQYQYIETCSKTNTADNTGPGTNTENANIATQVWQSDLTGTIWTYLGFGSII